MVLKVKNGTSFCPDEIFEFNPKGKGEINAKPKSSGYKRNVYKKQPNIIGPHP